MTVQYDLSPLAVVVCLLTVVLSPLAVVVWLLTVQYDLPPLAVECVC